MLTYKDCLDMCDLTEEQINAVAEHDHIDRLQALAKAGYLVNTSGGERRLRRIIIDDIRQAQARGDKTHESELKQVLIHFIRTHPDHGLSQR